MITILLFFKLPFASAQNVTLHTLSSGKQIKIIAEGKIFFKVHTPALMLKYETNINIDDVASLKQEAEEIWKDFRFEAEKNGYTGVVLSAYQPSDGAFISHGKGYNFVFVKNKTGGWDLVK